MHDVTEAQRYIVAVTVATEVPPDAPIAEFKAVIDVIRNRAASGKWWGGGTVVLSESARRMHVPSLLYVVMAKNQFSAVCREDYWRRALAGDWQPRHVARCLAILQTDWPDTTDGATHYYSPIGMQPPGCAPSWAAVMRETFPPGVRARYFRFFKQGAQ